MKHVNKRWGSYRTFCLNQNQTTVKLLTVDPEKKLSFQRHRYRTEHWFVIAGIAEVKLTDVMGRIRKQTLYPGDNVIILQHRWHSVANIMKGHDLEILEISMGHFDEKDIERKVE